MRVAGQNCGLRANAVLPLGLVLGVVLAARAGCSESCGRELWANAVLLLGSVLGVVLAAEAGCSENCASGERGLF